MRSLMATMTQRKGLGEAGLAIFVVSVVALMILPLPTALLDVLIAANITLAVLVLLTSLYLKEALAFGSFPTVLLITTLYRLSLNVASTRLILLHADAGEVISAFGNFVVSGNFIVGAVVFLILTLVQFLVIAKGSERVAEVGARFTLDAMPGKQMAIDAELRSGALTQDDARARRRALQRESQFYGAMDGAMKFVKGDAIAGIVITVVNILGGLTIGIAMRGMDAKSAIVRYGVLTIGDGLVSQIPALLISTAAGLVVTRVASEDEGGSLGSELARQMFGNRGVLSASAVVVALLALVPGLPGLPFGVLASLLAVLAWRQWKRPEFAHQDTGATRIASRAPVSAMLLSVGDSGDLERAKITASQLVERVWSERGLPVPSIETRVEPALGRANWSFSLRGLPIASGVIADAANLESAIWRVLSPRLHELFGLDSLARLLEQQEKLTPVLLRNVTPKPISLVLLHDVLNKLVEEGVSLVPLEEILHALATRGREERDPLVLAELVRGALFRHFTQAHAKDGEVRPVLLDPMLEDAVRESIRKTANGTFLTLAPALARDIVESVAAAAEESNATVLLTHSDIRRFVRKLVEVRLPALAVLGFQELGPEVRVTGSVVARPPRD